MKINIGVWILARIFVSVTVRDPVFKLFTTYSSHVQMFRDVITGFTEPFDTL